MMAASFRGLLGSGPSWRLQILVGWFGVRRIGSLYYLMFAVVFGPHLLNMVACVR